MRGFGLAALASLFAGLGASSVGHVDRSVKYATPIKGSIRPYIDRNNLPHGYPGSKLARKAAQGKIAICHK